MASMEWDANNWYSEPFDPRDSRVPSHALKVTVLQNFFPITDEVLRQVFDPYGVLEEVHMSLELDHVEALVVFQSRHDAAEAYGDLHGRNIYDGCCQLVIQWADTTIAAATTASATTTAATTVAESITTASTSTGGVVSPITTNTPAAAVSPITTNTPAAATTTIADAIPTTTAISSTKFTLSDEAFAFLIAEIDKRFDEMSWEIRGNIAERFDAHCKPIEQRYEEFIARRNQRYDSKDHEVVVSTTTNLVTASLALPTASSTSVPPQDAAIVVEVVPNKCLLSTHAKCSTDGLNLDTGVLMFVATASSSSPPSPTSTPTLAAVLDDTHRVFEVMPFSACAFSVGIDKSAAMMCTRLDEVVNRFCDFHCIGNVRHGLISKLPKPPWLLCAEVAGTWDSSVDGASNWTKTLSLNKQDHCCW